MQQAKEIDSHLYKLGIQEATLVTPDVTYKGTKYQKSMIVVTEGIDMNTPLEKFPLILKNSSDVYFAIEKYQSIPVVDLGVHCLIDLGISCKNTPPMGCKGCR